MQPKGEGTAEGREAPSRGRVGVVVQIGDGTVAHAEGAQGTVKKTSMVNWFSD
jgi:hypothetical protein